MSHVLYSDKKCACYTWGRIIYFYLLKQGGINFAVWKISEDKIVRAN